MNYSYLVLFEITHFVVMAATSEAILKILLLATWHFNFFSLYSMALLFTSLYKQAGCIQQNDKSRLNCK